MSQSIKGDYPVWLAFDGQFRDSRVVQKRTLNYNIYLTAGDKLKGLNNETKGQLHTDETSVLFPHLFWI